MRRSPSPRVAGRTAPPWRRPQLTVVTNALIIALECATDAQMKVAMTGGVVRINTLQAVGRWRSWHSDHHRGNRYRLRNYCGRLGWLANTKRHVTYESWRERDHLIAFEFDPDVLEGAARPFGLRFVSADGAEGLHTRTSSSVWSTADVKIRLTVAVETNSMDVQQRLAAAGIGFTVLPSIAVADDIARGHLQGAAARRRPAASAADGAAGDPAARPRGARGGRPAGRRDAALGAERRLALSHLAGRHPRGPSQIQGQVPVSRCRSRNSSTA